MLLYFFVLFVRFYIKIISLYEEFHVLLYHEETRLHLSLSEIIINNTFAKGKWNENVFVFGKGSFQEGKLVGGKNFHANNTQNVFRMNRIELSRPIPWPRYIAEQVWD